MTNAYHSIPELGYQGNRSIESRLDGISVLEGHCNRATVLDLGCAEGVVARALVSYGARLVHGFDVAEERLETARGLFATLPGQESLTYAFLIGDFSDMARFRNEFAAELRKAYDIVLLLGVMHDAEEAVQRTGTKFLSSLLDSHSEIRSFGEVLSTHKGPFPLLHQRGKNYRFGYREFLRKSFRRQMLHANPFTRPRTVRTFLYELIASRKETAIGFRLMLTQINLYPVVLDWMRDSDVRAIRIERENVLRTYISRLVKSATKNPHPTEKIRVPKVEVAHPNLIRQLDALAAANLKCAEIAYQFKNLCVRYESIAVSRDPELERILAFLALPSEPMTARLVPK